MTIKGAITDIRHFEIPFYQESSREKVIETIIDECRESRNKTIDDVINTLAENEDTMLTDKQYYTLMELKGGAENA